MIHGNCLLKIMLAMELSFNMTLEPDLAKNDRHFMFI